MHDVILNSRAEKRYKRLTLYMYWFLIMKNLKFSSPAQRNFLKTWYLSRKYYRSSHISKSKKNDLWAQTVIFFGSQFEHGIKMKVFDTPALIGSLAANRIALKISEFPFPTLKNIITRSSVEIFFYSYL